MAFTNCTVPEEADWDANWVLGSIQEILQGAVGRTEFESCLLPVSLELIMI